MKRNMKYNKITSAVMVLSLGLACSCTDDWDNHYGNGSSDEGCSLWQTIKNDGELNNFAAVLEATGYKAALDGSQVFTVFAPSDSQFSEAQRDSVIDLYKQEVAAGVSDKRNAAIKEFVKNHIALYNYSVSSVTNDSIVMMNGKYGMLKTDSFRGRNFLSSNVKASNGILFKMSGISNYTPNVYEYIGRDADLDSLTSYIYGYSIDEFDASQSVPGEIVNGKTQYLDSVTVLRNKLLTNWMDANIDEEDSTYWMIAPVNQVWDSLLTEYANYYQYDAKVEGRDSLMYNFPRRAIVQGSAFSRTLNPDDALQDSAMSTNSVPYSRRRALYGSYDKKYYQYDRPYDAGGVFDGAEEIVCSNGKVFKTSTWNIDKKSTFYREIVMEGESTYFIDSVYSISTREPSYGSVASYNPYYNKVSNNYFAILAPSGNSNYKALIQVMDVLSNVPYDVYVVAVPAVAGDTLVAQDQRVPTIFRATVSYHLATGEEDSFDSVDKLTTDATKVDSVFVGTYTFPTCSYNLEEAQVKILIEGRVSNRQVTSGTHTKTLRVDCVVLKPHEE